MLGLEKWGDMEGRFGVEIDPAGQLRPPTVLVAASNLKRACRLAKKWGGAVEVAADAMDLPANVAPRAVLRDPDRRRWVVEHAYRRNPFMSIQLGCRDVTRAIDFYRNCLGFKVTHQWDGSVASRADAIRETSAFPDVPGARLTSGDAHNTTGIVVLESDAPPAMATIVTIAVSDLAATFGWVARRPEVQCGAFVEGEDSDFVCTDLDGNVLRVEQRVGES